MNHSTHIIDPDGDMMIVLQNADTLFAQIPEDVVPGKFSGNLLEPYKNKPFPPWSASQDAPLDQTPQGNTAGKQMRERMDKREVRFQVSAKHMMLASSFSKKALTGAWRESETYQQKGSVEVTADGWNSEALLIILRAMHCQHKRIPKKVGIEMLANIAAIADYFDCKDVLYMIGEIWVSSLDEKAPTCSRDLAFWLWVAWFFKLPTKFKACTSILMTRSDNLIGFSGLPIPATITESMNQSRQDAIENVMLCLYGTLDRLWV
ncbi:hypothetical protein N7488_011010 [Penicillium malachiteum]|nr:hypothetical protein N7488_011010 [Penicillium malachiteum]